MDVMHRNTIRYLLLAGLLILLQSCSLKEERSDCPCWLDVFFGNFPEEGLVLSAWQGEKLFKDDVTRDDFTDFYEKEVKRGLVSLSAYRNSGALSVSGDIISIQKGSQADSLYAYSSYVECFGEFAADTVHLYKQFATVFLQLKNSADNVYPYWVRIIGNVSGTQVRDLSPVGGEFLFDPTLSETQGCTFRLPRQKDDSLILEFHNISDGSLADSINLGAQIASAGFDWGARSLNDIIIEIDFAKVGMEITVREWESEDIYDITI